MKAEFPAGASAKRAAIPAPNPSVLTKKKVQNEPGGNPYKYQISCRDVGRS
jgi:hypothetical protein